MTKCHNFQQHPPDKWLKRIRMSLQNNQNIKAEVYGRTVKRLLIEKRQSNNRAEATAAAMRWHKQ